jgi:hypothetical protein
MLFFFNFWSLKPWIRIGLQHHTLDPDPEKINTNPQPCGDKISAYTQSTTIVLRTFRMSHKCFRRSNRVPVFNIDEKWRCFSLRLSKKN